MTKLVKLKRGWQYERFQTLACVGLAKILPVITIAGHMQAELPLSKEPLNKSVLRG